MKHLFVRLRRGAHAPTVALLALGLLLPAVSARGAGFEKAVNWSGVYAGVGGAGLASATGSEALYFNPAGLVGPDDTEIALNISPTFTRLSGGMAAGNTSNQLWTAGDRKVSPVASTLASYPLSSRWAAGIGFYVTGGMKAYYEDVSYQSLVPWATLTPTVKVDLAITEVALGTAYQLAPGWKVGGAWRVVNVAADFSSARVLTRGSTPIGLMNVHFTDLAKTKYNGMRLGVQYQAPDDKWGLGASWRNAVEFTATGDSATSLQVVNPATGGAVNVPVANGTASINNTLPQQWAVGVYYRENPKLKLLGEVAWSEYSVNQVLDINGTLALPASLGGNTPISDITEQWGNMTNVRLGAEYTGLGAWTLRAGYVFTSRVTPSGYARATFAAPGEGHSFTLGAGRSVSERIKVNAAVEYSVASGHGRNAEDNIADTLFRSNAVVLHTGATYHF